MGDNKDSLKANLNLKGEKANTYDVIVIGSGISGGWAAKEFCEKGLKTLMLERGRMVEHIKDYKTANTSPWDFPHRIFCQLKYGRKTRFLAVAMLLKNQRNIFL